MYDFSKDGSSGFGPILQSCRIETNTNTRILSSHPDSKLLSEKGKKSVNSRFLVSEQSDEFRKKFYPGTSKKEWNNYHWQLRKRIKDLNDFKKILNLSSKEKQAFDYNGRKFITGITPYYASLLDPNDHNDPIRRTVIPTSDEFVFNKNEFLDPLAEDTHSPVPGIVHRYPDRVLFLITDFCPVYCRYCTRSRMVGGNATFDINLNQWKRAIAYIATNKCVRDVLISGGDPLAYSDNRIEWLLAELRSIRHLEVIRIGTKIPFVLPQRITLSLIRVIKRYHPVYFSLHVIHPKELTPEASQVCERLADAGIPLGSQTVLLKNINDTIETIQILMRQLLRIRVKPYYLLQCDPIVGSSHFRTPIETGINIIRGLRGHVSGYAVPHFIVDLPEGGGKISLVPDHMTGRKDDHVVFINYEGKDGFKYPDPEIS